MSSIAVVIPYFQRRPGLLATALQSVSRQTVVDMIQRVIVVDDGSPRPAKFDIASLDPGDRVHAVLELIERRNGGVSSARNAGLDRVPPHTEYVAFLDPDDVWLPNHLEWSIAGLETGSDFHFSNFTHIGQSVGAFERAGYLTADQHELIVAPFVHRYEGNMVRQITCRNVIGTTSVVYRFSRARNNRFAEDFKFAGEDYLMWLSLLPSARSITFTSAITANCGEGVNLFSGAAWGSDHLARRLLDEINYRSHLLRSVSMDDDNLTEVKALLDDNRRAYLGNGLSMLKRLKLSVLPLVIGHIVRNSALRELLFRRV
ncbi:MAG: glycosyltransferase family 2 protein [Burkholderiaceae bacterium]|nr:glycosyltransferase family 2 protein [Burkholderiaceae bacterium]